MIDLSLVKSKQCIFEVTNEYRWTYNRENTNTATRAEGEADKQVFLEIGLFILGKQ